MQIHFSLSTLVIALLRKGAHVHFILDFVFVRNVCFTSCSIWPFESIPKTADWDTRVDS